MSTARQGQGPGAQGIFITGTDTGVGKTLIATTILGLWATHGLAVAGYKPVAAGCEVEDGVLSNADARRLLAASSIPLSYAEVNPYALVPAIAPHLAAADAGITLAMDRMVAGYEMLSARAERIVVEGAGGWAVPLDDELTFADLALALDLPVVLVVGIRLGCINHALLTQDAILASGARFAGWVANEIDPEMREPARNVDTLVARLDAPHLGSVPFQRPGAPAPAACIDLSLIRI
jgi:dethiobiotin synthetase